METLSYETLLSDLGYKTSYRPRLGTLGRALLKASNRQRSNKMLMTYWDDYFNKLRQKKKDKHESTKLQKQNS